MTRRMSGRNAAVTGGASGIGRETAALLAAEGAKVAVLDLDEAGAVRVAAELVAAGAEAIGVQADVTRPDTLERAVRDVEAAFGPIDAVSSNAGLARYPAPVDEIDPKDFEAIFAVNVAGVFNTVRAVVPSLRRAGGGSIVITGSIMGERARAGLSVYAASKSAANHLARGFALDLAGDGIRVNAVAPVATDTAMLPAFLGPDHPEEARAAFIAGIPLGRLATPRDVASAILFLASEEASFITGVVLPVDGGRGV